MSNHTPQVSAAVVAGLEASLACRVSAHADADSECCTVLQRATSCPRAWKGSPIACTPLSPPIATYQRQVHANALRTHVVVQCSVIVTVKLTAGTSSSRTSRCKSYTMWRPRPACRVVHMQAVLITTQSASRTLNRPACAAAEAIARRPTSCICGRTRPAHTTARQCVCCCIGTT